MIFRAATGVEPPLPDSRAARAGMGFPYFSRRLGYAAIALVALVLGGSVTLNLALDRAATERQTLREVGVLADAMAAQAGAMLSALEQTLLGLSHMVNIGARPDAILTALGTRENAAPDGVVLALLERNGELRAATGAGRRRIAGLQQDALRQFLAAMPLEMPPGHMVVGLPARSASGPVLPMAQLMEDGNFALALLPLRVMEAFYARLDLIEGTSVTLMDYTGRLLARLPPTAPEAIGELLTSTPSPGRMLALRQDWTGRILSGIDGYSRYTALRFVPGQPLAVAVGLRVTEVMAPWVRRAQLGGLLTLFSIAAAAAGIILVGREARRRLALQARATQRLERLAHGSAGIAAMVELPALLGHVSRLGRETLGAPYACVTLLHGDDPDDQGSRQHAISTAPEAGLDDTTLAALAAWSAAQDRDTETAPRIRATGPDSLPARASVTLRDETGRLLGWLDVAGSPGGFSADDQAMLAQLARLTEIAIRNRGLIAAMRRAAEEASSAKERIERLLESISECFVALDAGWCFTYVNDAALRLLGQRREAMIGRSVWELYPVLNGLEAFGHLQNVASRGKPMAFEQYFESSQCWLQAQAFPAADGVAVFFRDVTEARQTQWRMQQSQRMEAMGRLTGSVAHDFNNLLAVVIGNAEMLEDDLADDPERRHAAWLIRDAGERGAALVRHLLAFASHQPQAAREVVPEALLNGLMPLLQRSMGTKVRIERTLGGKLPRVRLDPGQAENAILNLAINARDAMPGGGVLTLAMDAVNQGPEELTGFPDAQPGLFLRLTVSDTGAGMAPGVLERAVEPFFSTKMGGQGAGLGLATVYSFARQNGGALRLESTQGQGTRVTLLLPTLDHAVTLAAIKPPLPPPPPPRGDEHVLLVEDEAALRDSIARQLTGLGYSVTALEDGPAAVAALDAGLRPDLMLSDVIMPGGISGPRLAELVRKRLPQLPVLLMSGFALEPGEPMPGRDMLIVKPCDSATLAGRLRDLLDVRVEQGMAQDREPQARFGTSRHNEVAE